MSARVRIYDASDVTREVLLPVTPAELSESGEAETRDFTVIGAGSGSYPNGRSERHFPVQGRLPGASRRYLPHVQEWRGPSAIIDQIRAWVREATSLTLEYDGLAGQLTCPVYVKRYQFTRTGAHGDVDFDLEFVELRQFLVTIDTGSGTEAAPAAAAGPATAAGSGAGTHAMRELPAPGAAPAVPSTYTVQPGDTLSLIARKLLGDSSRWRDIYQINGITEPDLIYPGQVLAIPDGEAPAQDLPITGSGGGELLVP